MCLREDSFRSPAPCPRPATPADEPVRASRRRPRTPTYEGSGLPFGGSYPTREESWAAMSVKIRDRPSELAGDGLAWFAATIPCENRPRAGPGTTMYRRTEDRSTGRLVYALNRYEFAPGSHKKVPVEHRPGPDDGAAQRVASQPGASSPQPRSDLGSSPHDAGQLGNLPPKAQELLQAP